MMSSSTAKTHPDHMDQIYPTREAQEAQLRLLSWDIVLSAKDGGPVVGMV